MPTYYHNRGRYQKKYRGRQKTMNPKRRRIIAKNEYKRLRDGVIGLPIQITNHNYKLVRPHIYITQW